MSKLQPRESTGYLNFQDQTVQSSLFRNGRVRTQRFLDGSDAPMEGVSLVKREVTIHNARQLPPSEQTSCHKNGFQLLDAPLTNPEIDFFDHHQVGQQYYAECAALVADITGAKVYAFDHNIRSATGQAAKKQVTGEQKVQPPIHIVHGDYTLVSGPQRLKDLTSVPGANDTLRNILPRGQSLISTRQATNAVQQGRFAIINVWRSIVPEPVQIHPLALCDGQSVMPQDLVVFEIHYQDRIGENYFAKYSPHQKWFYYPEMNRDEALLIKQWDSSGGLAKTNGQQADRDAPDAPCTFSFHSAFEDPATPIHAPDRWSIEVRCMVIYD